MSEKLSVDQVITKARNHAEKGEVQEALRLYQTISESFCKKAKDVQQRSSVSNKPKLNNVTQRIIPEVIDQLAGLYNQGKYLAVLEQAEVCTRRFPEIFIFWHLLGVSAIKIGMPDKAIAAFKKVIFLKPDYPDAYNNMGVALQDQGKLDDAIDAHKKSITLNPNYSVAYSNLGNILQARGKLDEAIEFYNKAILIDPNYTDVYYNMGNALKDQGKLDEAIESYNKTLLINPIYPVVHNNLGNALKDQGKHNEAIKAYRKALFFDPDNAEVHANLSSILLSSGKIKDGFEEYEWRWRTEKLSPLQRHFSKPKWDGKLNLKDKTIFIWCEQGIGDTMNWSSCLSRLTSCAKHVILECQKKLVPLLSRSFPNVEVKAQDRSLDAHRDDFDLHLPMGSLYKHFIDEIMENDKGDAYLVPDPARVKFWRKRLKSLGKGPYIGVCWKSSVVSAYRSQHYPPISDWSPVLTTPDVTFINLQYTDYADDIVKVQDEFGVTIHNFDDLDQYDDIDDVAALCAALDMVVSTKATPPMISAGVGTSTKIANWRQSSFNNILTNPVTSSYDMFDRETWEKWDKVFNLIAKDIFEFKK